MLRVLVDLQPGRRHVLRPEGSIDAETMRYLEAEADGLPAVTAVDLDGVRFIDTVAWTCCGDGRDEAWSCAAALCS